MKRKIEPRRLKWYIHNILILIKKSKVHQKEDIHYTFDSTPRARTPLKIILTKLGKRGQWKEQRERGTTDGRETFFFFFFT